MTAWVDLTSSAAGGEYHLQVGAFDLVVQQRSGVWRAYVGGAKVGRVFGSADEAKEYAQGVLRSRLQHALAELDAMEEGK